MLDCRAFFAAGLFSFFLFIFFLRSVLPFGKQRTFQNFQKGHARCGPLSFMQKLQDGNPLIPIAHSLAAQSEEHLCVADCDGDDPTD